MTVGLIRTVASEAGMSSASARRVARSAAHRYKVYEIPKRRGGTRVVAQPAREVKALQRALVTYLSEFLPVHAAATAYKNGASITKNAAEHRASKFLTKLDFQDFFPSIGGADIRALLASRCAGRFTEVEVEFIVQLLLWRDVRHGGRLCLCIGAPSSPFISNAIMFDFDERASALCGAHEVAYTRYSDDISLSSRVPDVLMTVEQALKILANSLSSPNLRFNDQKRVAVSRATSMTVTGLTLSNQGAVTVGRVRKRGVRAGVQHFVAGRLNDVQARRLLIGQ